MGLACLLFLHRMAGLSHAQWEAWSDDVHAQTGVAVCRLRGPLFFGAVDRLESVLDAAYPPALQVIVDMSEVSYLDTSALEVLEDYERVLRESGGALAVVGAPENVASLIRRSGFIEKLAGRQIHASRGEALAQLRIAPLHA
jgi:SulP family sulfate permease